MQIVIEIDEARYKDIQRIAEVQLESNHFQTAEQILAKGIPIEQEPKTGHWEWVQYDSNPNIGNWHCSECRTIIPHMPEETDNTPIYKWCPMCGCHMVKPQESEDKE